MTLNWGPEEANEAQSCNTEDAIASLAQALGENTAALREVVEALGKAAPRPGPVVPTPAATGDLASAITALWLSTFGETLGPTAQNILMTEADGDLPGIFNAVQSVAAGIASGRSQKPNKPLSYVTAVIRRQRQPQTAPQESSPYPAGVTVIKDEEFLV